MFLFHLSTTFQVMDDSLLNATMLNANSSESDLKMSASRNLTDIFHNVCPQVDILDLQEALSHCEHKKCQTSSIPECMSSLESALSELRETSGVVGQSCGAIRGEVSQAVGHTVYELMECLVRLLPTESGN